MLKGVLVILDGVGDLPNEQLKGKTPLEAAETPNLDFFATRGEMGYMYPVRPGFIPESDEAIVSIFGNDLISSTRGQLEASGTDIKITRGDLAFRVNFATIDSLKGKIVDRRAGRTLTTDEAEQLSLAINQIEMPFGFVFEPSVQHRASLVFRGGFSDRVSGNDFVYTKGKVKISNVVSKCLALDETENTAYTVNVVNDFLKKVYEVLKDHPVNQERIRKGLLPANYLLLRGAGIEIPKLKQYRRWVSLGYMPLEVGFSKISGMKVYRFDYPRLTSLDSYDNLHDGLKKSCKKAIKMIKKFSKSADYAYVHIKETDLPGHDNKPFEKKNMIEYIDKTFFRFLRKFAPPRKIRIAVTADHSTPCKLKTHSADPVPVLLYNDSLLKEKHFSEKEARVGSLGKILGKELLKKIKFVK
jgi:2,3-bisphosphoglycerate-independent phosphoglycerate mutase